MRRRSRAGGEPAKAHRRKTVARKSRVTSKAADPSSSSAAREETKVARLTRELNESLEQQTAMSEVLRVISQSKFELQSVLQSVAETAASLCRSDGAVIFQLEGGIYRFAAGYSLAPAFLKIERQTLISPGPGTVVGRAAMTRRVARIDDALADPLYEKKEDAKVEGNRSMIGVPVLRDGEPVIVIGLGRRRFDPFGKREIELAITFAAQALIAIENARLVSDLRDSLQQQTATADVLKVISGSIFDLQTVLDTRVPLMREEEPIGVIILTRQGVEPFTEKQIELVTTFADQAVIAIENSRLLNELRQRTEELGQSVGELRALGEVSQAVNSTLDLETVLSTIVANAVQLSGTEAGAIYVFYDQQREFHLRATYGMDEELIDALTQQRISLDEPNVAQALAQPEPVQVADLREEAPNQINEITLRAGFLARLVAPLRRGEDVVGFLVVRRRAPGAFPQNTVDLIKTFAAQSAVAIENARLFKNVQTSLEDLRTTQDRLVQTQKLASLGQLTAGIAHEIKNPLNFVNNFSGVSAELIDELREAVNRMTGDDKTRAEITELTNTLRDNLDKIVQHGKRADAIVKNMLLHSREGSGEHRPVDVNALVEESLNLAYHGARAEKQGFKINIQRSFDPAAGQVDVYPQEITRAFLNLISNGFYAATKRKEQSNNDGYEPTLTATTKNLGEKVEIRIRDNGVGIPPEVKEKMFNPFFTTKPAGEGTGLGLSITHDIIVKQHSGSIEVDTQPGEFTEIRIILPRTATFIAESGGRA